MLLFLNYETLLVPNVRAKGLISINPCDKFVSFARGKENWEEARGDRSPTHKGPCREIICPLSSQFVKSGRADLTNIRPSITNLV